MPVSILSLADTAPQSSLDELLSSFERQLQVLLLLARSENKKAGKPLFPALAKMIVLLLNGTVPIAKDPSRYQNGHPSYLDGDQIGKLKKALEFLQILQSNGEEPGDLDVRIDRLMSFNDAAAGKIQLNLSPNEKQKAKSVFSSLALDDFYQLQVPVRYPKISCLSHLIEQGLLDTQMPVSDLHCVEDRLKYGTNAKCQLPFCPVLDGR